MTVEGEGQKKYGGMNLGYLRFLLANYIPVTVAGIVFGQRLFSADIQVIEGGEEVATSLWLFALVILVSGFILLLIKLRLSKYLYLMTEYGGLLIFSFFIFSLYLQESFSLLLSFLLLAARLLWKRTKPYASLVMASGAAALLGSSLDVLPTIILMVLLSVYDVLAVKKTRHMQVIAQDVFEKQGSQIFVSESENDIFILGVADIVFPCALATSAFLQYNLPIAASTSLFGLLGLILATRHSEAPALPYASLSIAGFALGLLVFS